MSMGSHHSAVMVSDTYLTPPEIIAACGPFDLDPCAAPEPRPWPTAERHIVLPEDGLAADWGDALIWLNPPYSREARAWLMKLSQHPGGGIALIFARTETEWFVDSVWHAERATAILFLHGRITFRDRKGDPVKVFDKKAGKWREANSGAPSVLVAYGNVAAARLLASGLPGSFLHLGRSAA